MNKEQLIAKKVKHQFNGKETLFSVNSLTEHFEGLEIHESDILTDEFEDQEGGYVKVSDINFDLATPKEITSNEKGGFHYFLHKEEDLEKSVFIKKMLNKNKIEHTCKNGMFAINVDTLPESLNKEEFYSWFEEKKKEKEVNELTIQPEDPAFGTEGIILFKTPEQADAEIKKENEGIEPENKEDNENVKTEDVKEIKVEDPVIETGKEEKEENEENVEQKTTSRKNFETKTTNKK